MTLASLQQALTDNYEQIESFLSQKKYNDALAYMDVRLVLIDHLLRLVENEPELQQEALLLAAMLSLQEERMKNLACHHHQTIFKELSSIGLASKAKKIYNVNSKEF
ncbi:hypothetical protein AO724_01685 [Aeromonas allosaccharophila]|uniref:hypothetical protein n=1 Tax=Aeromonas allosaccharophila TaxID=656 RepID=UPI0007181C63|nr:hypothetical protein [Aeromonas allosaccharophila]KRW64380.1 hypothetical protein AO724_01685 [Aeromonas allosaccharophila]